MFGEYQMLALSTILLRVKLGRVEHKIGFVPWQRQEIDIFQVPFPIMVFAWGDLIGIGPLEECLI